MTEKLYADRDASELEPHFMNHMMAMTGEGLNGKAEIACELAWRDKENATLKKENRAVCWQSDKYLELCKIRGKEIATLKQQLAESENQYQEKADELASVVCEKDQLEAGVAELKERIEAGKRIFNEIIELIGGS